MEVVSTISFVPSPYEDGTTQTNEMSSRKFLTCNLMTKISFRRNLKTASDVMVYLHGFPDMSVHPTSGDFASRLPRKLEEKFFRMYSNGIFICFNFSGIFGSDDNPSLLFQHKTISREVIDAQAIITYIKEKYSGCNIHIVGVSTGAIVASLLRDKYDTRDKMTITCIAGLVDIAKGVQYDFNPHQLQCFDKNGYCMKEFWIPKDLALKTYSMDATGKIFLQLGKQYRDECVNGTLDIYGSVSKGVSPFLIIHGENDVHVPIENADELFEAAQTPKFIVKISKANHLFTNSNHFNKLWKAISDHLNRVA